MYNWNMYIQENTCPKNRFILIAQNSMNLVVKVNGVGVGVGFLNIGKILLWLLLMMWHGWLNKLNQRIVPNLLQGILGPKVV